MSSNKNDQFGMDKAKKELLNVMHYFEYLTKKVVSFGVLSQDDHGKSTLCSTSEYIKCEPAGVKDNHQDISPQLITSCALEEIEDGEIIENVKTYKRKAPSPDTITTKRSRPSNMALNIITQKKFVLPTIYFEGYAANENYNHSRYYALLLIEGEYVNHFIESFENCLETCSVKTRWYPHLKSCFEKAKKEIYIWFNEHVHQNLSFSDVKSKIRKQYGYENPIVQTASVYYINQPQKPNQDFSLYFETYRRAAKGFCYVDKESILGTDYLIGNFIQGTYHRKVSLAMYDLLRSPFFKKKRDQTLPFSEREHLTNGKRYTDVPRSWVEFEKLIDREMYYLLMCEEGEKQDSNKNNQHI